MAERPASSHGAPDATDAAHSRPPASRVPLRVAASTLSSATSPSSANLAALLLSSRDEIVLAALIESPEFDEHHSSLLPRFLERKDLPESILSRIAKRTRWLEHLDVRQKLAAHPRTPRHIAARLLREFHLLDLVQFSLQPSTPIEARRLAEELIVSRIGQLPLGQKKMLARRGSAQVAGALLADSSSVVVAAALDNSFLTESQVLKSLSRRTLDVHAVSAIGRHAKWRKHNVVRLAIVAHPHAPPDLVMSALPELTRRDLDDLAALPHLPASARQHVQHEIACRLRPARKLPTP